ncbi:MAG: zinc-binding dehydrogenase [Bryobacterales bacterium]|nr:zinc-binding dehydrogenase [Bryobacterales bacterium]
MPVRAAVLAAYHQPLEIREYPEISHVGPGEVLVRMEMAGICGTDVHLWQGQLPIPVPVILGHETVGRIEALGDGVEVDWRGDPVSADDRITWASSLVCGECYYCRVKRQPTRCVARKAYGISYCADEAPHLRGGYAEAILLRPGTALYRLPDHLPTEAVVGAGCGLVTAIHGIERCPIEWGDVVVVQGSGPVGLAALAVAREAGAAKVVVIGGPPHRLEIARRFGADAVIDVGAVPDPEERHRVAQREISPHGADVVIECVGHPQAVNEGIALCRDGGAYLVLGQYADAGNIEFNPHIITRKQLRVIGSWGFEPRHVDKALALLARDKQVRDLFASEITHHFRLADADRALQTVRNWQSGKSVLIP